MKELTILIECCENCPGFEWRTSSRDLLGCYCEFSQRQLEPGDDPFLSIPDWCELEDAQDEAAAPAQLPMAL